MVMVIHRRLGQFRNTSRVLPSSTRQGFWIFPKAFRPTSFYFDSVLEPNACVSSVRPLILGADDNTLLLSSSFCIAVAASPPLLSEISMSKFELQKAAHERSGVSYEESTIATDQLQPSIYQRLGEEGLRRLSTLFYDRVFADKETKWFINIFSSSTRAEAIENQYLFLVERFGGPAIYKAKKGKYTRLVGRHANYHVGSDAADRWVEHMKAAMEEHESLKEDEEAKDALYKYFRYTSHYIVVASAYMRPDQVCAIGLSATTFRCIDCGIRLY